MQEEGCQLQVDGHDALIMRSANMVFMQSSLVVK